MNQNIERDFQICIGVPLNLTVPQMLLTHLASANQLPGFCKIGTLPVPNMRNTKR